MPTVANVFGPSLPVPPPQQRVTSGGISADIPGWVDLGLGLIGGSGGVGIPGTGGYGQICPPGTACSGPSIQLPGGISGCLGTCRETATGQGGGDWYLGGCPQGTYPAQQPDGSVRCVDAAGLTDTRRSGGDGTQGTVVSTCGYKGTQRRVITPAFTDGKPCCPSGYHLNETEYRLRDGTCVPARSRCVKNRRMNPANYHAGRTATRRLNRFHRALKDTEKALKKLRK